MLHEKIFHVNKKKVDVAQNSIACRQKQDDATSKKYIGCKKIIFFFRSGAPYKTNYMPVIASFYVRVLCKMFSMIF